MTDLQEPRRRALLPFLDLKRHGNRSHVTCFYKCGNACDSAIPNQSDNPTFADVVQTAFSRRSMLKAAGVGALVVAAGPLAPSPAAAHQRGPSGPPGGPRGGALTFRPVAQNQLDELVTAQGYRYSVVMRWGDPVVFGAPEFDIARQTPEAQAQQFGYNCDYIGLLPLDDKDREALLVVNHEYTNEQLMFSGVASESSPTTPQQKRIAMMAHGISVVEVRRHGNTGEWRPVRNGKRNRRITADTPMEFTGPAAGSEYLKTKADPRGRTVLGTLNNCAGGQTPWGTTLHGEENFNQYFGPAAGPVPDPEKRLSRYGISATTAAGRRWHEVDPRFDLAAEPNEVNRFGWVVEVDPYDPTSRPKKRTAMGRFKHEGANVRIAEDGRVVAYSGDDERFDYIYKFVSRRSTGRQRQGLPRAQPDAARRGRPLRRAVHRRLAAGRDHRHRGCRGPRVRRHRPVDPAGEGREVDGPEPEGRLGADLQPAAGRRPRSAPTPMDRPEDIQVNPVNGRVYAALTNNTNRGVGTNPKADEANPRTANRHGHVVEWEETGGAAGDGSPGDLPGGRRPGRPEHLLRRVRQRRSAPSPVPTTWSSTPPATCGSPPTAARATSPAATTASTPSPPREGARPGQAVPHGAVRGGVQRSADHPGRAVGLRRRAAPG